LSITLKYSVSHYSNNFFCTHTSSLANRSPHGPSWNTPQSIRKSTFHCPYPQWFKEFNIFKLNSNLFTKDQVIGDFPGTEKVACLKLKSRLLVSYVPLIVLSFCSQVSSVRPSDKGSMKVKIFGRLHLVA
jgi:hypothetical protein